jgi:hypothetical protein
MRWVWLLVALLMATAANAEPHAISLGFALRTPEPKAARQHAYDQTDLTLFSPGLQFWADLSELEAGDHLVLRLRGPDGGIMAERDIPIDLRQKRFFAFTGRKRPDRGWQSGAYTGTLQVIRSDQILIEETKQIALP